MNTLQHKHREQTRFKGRGTKKFSAETSIKIFYLCCRRNWNHPSKNFQRRQSRRDSQAPGPQNPGKDRYSWGTRLKYRAVTGSIEEISFFVGYRSSLAEEETVFQRKTSRRTNFLKNGLPHCFEKQMILIAIFLFDRNLVVLIYNFIHSIFENNIGYFFGFEIDSCLL